MNIEDNSTYFNSQLVNNKYKPYESSVNNQNKNRFGFEGGDIIVGIDLKNKNQNEILDVMKDYIYKFPNPNVSNRHFDNNKFNEFLNRTNLNSYENNLDVINRKNYNNLNVHYQNDRFSHDKIINKHRDPNWIYRDGKEVSVPLKVYDFSSKSDNKDEYIMVEKTNLRITEFKPTKRDFNKREVTNDFKDKKYDNLNEIINNIPKKSNDVIQIIKTKIYEKIN